MGNRLRYLFISLLLLSIVSLSGFLSTTPQQASAYTGSSSAALLSARENIPGLLVSGPGPFCIPEALRVVYDSGQQSACFVANAQVQLPRASQLFTGMYAGFVKGNDGQIVRFCPWKLYSVYVPLVVQVTITGSGTGARCQV